MPGFLGLKYRDPYAFMYQRPLTYAQSQRARSRRVPPNYRFKGKYRKKGWYNRYNIYPRGAMGGELKFLDSAVDIDPLATAGTVVDSLVHIAQGATQNERIGRKVVIKSIHIKSKLQIDDTAGVAFCTATIVRIMLYVDKQCNGATALVTDLLSVAEWDSFRSLDNSGRFKILLDKTVTFNDTGGRVPSSDGVFVNNQKKVIQINKRCNVPVIYDGATGAITEMCCNNIGLMLITDSIAATPSWLSTVRIRYQG